MLKKVSAVSLLFFFINIILISEALADFADLVNDFVSSEDSISSEKDDSFVNNLPNIFKKKNTILNCFGIPAPIAGALERLFTRKTASEDVQFYFYSRDSSDKVIVQAGENFHLSDINYQINRKTVFIIHGFMSSGEAEWVQDMADAFLKLEDINVIVVNWQRGSNTWNYYAASISTRIVGDEIVRLLKTMRQKELERNPDLKDSGKLHFVGHSLGAHISGYAARLIFSYQTNSGWIAERITGLDPAQPCFSKANPLLVLTKDDAQFIDVIHTNARNILLLGLGLPRQIGDIDFFPNGGQIQLGCNKVDTSFWNFLLLPTNIIKEAICSHGRSHELFIDSIKVSLSGECKFLGHEWDRTYDNLTELVKPNCDEGICPEMGINSVKYKDYSRGAFFVPTSETLDYCDVSEENRIAIIKQLRRNKMLNMMNNMIVDIKALIK